MNAQIAGIHGAMKIARKTGDHNKHFREKG